MASLFQQCCDAVCMTLEVWILPLVGAFTIGMTFKKSLNPPELGFVSLTYGSSRRWLLWSFSKKVHVLAHLLLLKAT